MNDYIEKLETTIQDRFKGNTSRTTRAFDAEYVLMLGQLKGAYTMRDSLEILDNFGLRTTDKDRVQILEEVLLQLEEEKRLFIARLSEDSADFRY